MAVYKRILLKLVRIIIRVYVEVFRGTPMILQAVFIYYGMPYFFGVSFKDIWTVSIIVVSVNISRTNSVDYVFCRKLKARSYNRRSLIAVAYRVTCLCHFRGSGISENKAADPAAFEQAAVCRIYNSIC